jgi:hypothetical protein
VDPLEAVFVFCFVFGVATSIVSFLLGSLHGIDGHHALPGGHSAPAGPDVGGHLGHGASAGGHGGDMTHGDAAAAHGADPRLAQISPFNLQTITVFLTFFGGVGWVLYDWLGFAPAIALVAGVVAGLAGGAVVFWFLVKVLLAGQRFMDPASSQMEGIVGSVTYTIGPTGTGEIAFSRDGSRHSAGARSATGLAIPIGTEVVVVRYEKGLAYVEPWSSFAGEE